MRASRLRHGSVCGGVAGRMLGRGMKAMPACVPSNTCLRRRTGDAVAVDGVFGPQMKAVTKTYQSRTGHTADGVIGRNTWYELLGGSPDAGND